jgi:hypothetical protein
MVDCRPATEARRRLEMMRVRPVVLAIAIAGSICFGACGGSSSNVPASGGDTYSIHGLVTASDCGKFGLYDLINAPVRVMDPTGKVIGTAITATQPSPFCHVPFTVERLPKASTYKIQVGFDEGPTYTFEQLSSKAWHVSFTV